MVSEQLSIALLGAIIGAVSGFFFFWGWERRKKINEINKIKELLNNDLARIYEVSIIAFKDVGEMLEEGVLKEKVDKFIEDKFPTDFVSSHYYAFTFVFWNSIVTSGSLIKLDLEEIREVETVYRITSGVEKLIDEVYVAWRQQISKFVAKSTITNEERDEMIFYTSYYFQELGMNVLQIKETMEEYLKDIDWITLPTLIGEK